jgi:spermidine synthase
MATLEILAGLSLLVSIIALYFIGPLFVKNPDIQTWNHLLSIQGLLSALLLFLPASCIGIMLPLAGKVYTQRFQKSGMQIGKLGSIFFAGAIAGLAITPFLVIPVTGVFNAFILLATLTLLSGIYLLFRDSRLKRGFRLGVSVLSACIFAGITFFVFTSTSMRISDKSEIASLEGTGSTVKVLQKGDHQVLTIHNIACAETNEEGLRIQELPAHLVSLLNPSIRSSLVIGFGMGVTANSLTRYTKSSIQIAEGFPEVMNLSSDVFADLNEDVLTNSQVDMVIDDPLMYLYRNNHLYDLILSGVENCHLMPALSTIRFYELCLARLSGDGLLCQVLPLNGISSAEFQSWIRSCTEVFPRAILCFASRDFAVLLASGNKTMFSYSRLTEVFHLNRSLPGMLTDDALRKLSSGAMKNTYANPVIEFSRTDVMHRDPEIVRLLNRLGLQNRLLPVL